jgi:hypothetical protein
MQSADYLFFPQQRRGAQPRIASKAVPFRVLGKFENGQAGRRMKCPPFSYTQEYLAINDKKSAEDGGER